MPTTHTRDSHCAGHIDEATDTCTVCGAYHGEPCLDCGGMAYHYPDCPTLEVPDPLEALAEVADHLAELLARSEVPSDAEPYQGLRRAYRALGRS